MSEQSWLLILRTVIIVWEQKYYLFIHMAGEQIPKFHLPNQSTKLTLEQRPENMMTNATKSRSRKEGRMREEVEANNEVGTVLLKLYEIPVKMKVRDVCGKVASDFNIGPQI